MSADIYRTPRPSRYRWLTNPYNPIAWMAWLLAVLLVLSVYEFRLSRACLAAGYPEMRWAPFTTTYCVRREDQTDRVVPLSEVRP